METQPSGDDRPGPTGAQGFPPPASGATPGSDAGPEAPTARSDSGFFGVVRSLDVQRADDRWIAGVCAGLANRTGLDPLIWRGIFAVSALLGGVGLVVYGIAWALLPERRDGRIHLEELFAGRFDVAVIGAAAFTVLGLGRGGDAFWFWGNGPHWFGGLLSALAGLMWIAFVVAIVVGIIAALNRRGSTRASVPPGPYGPYSGQPAPGQPSSGQTYPAATSSGQTYPTQTYGGPTYPGASAPAHPGQAHHGQAYQTQAYPSQAFAPYAATSQTQGAPAPAGQAYPATTYPAPPYVRTPPPVKAPKPPKPRRPRVAGPGPATVGIVVALSLLTLAVLLAADRTGGFDGPVLLTTVGISVTVAGLGIVVSGFRGRSSGFLGFLAIVGIIFALPVGAVTQSDWGWNDQGVHRFAGDVDMHVTTRADAAAGFTLGFGQANIDLTDVPMTSDVLVVPVSVGAGDVTIVVPHDAAVTADVRLRAGQFTWDVDAVAQHFDGVSTDTKTFTDAASTTGSAQLDLQISVGAGDVIVTREDS
ncbi:MAG: PspC domain-containing protein [Brevundimonas sp.]